MAKPTSVGRRLLSPAPIMPLPKPAAPPDVVLGALNPAAGGPVTQVPATAPGMLPTTEATPVYDTTKGMPSGAPPAGEDGWQGALQRALIGFNKGASRVQIDPTYNPIAAGLIGGTAAVGAEQENVLNRRLAAQQAAQKPFQDAQASALKTSAEEQARVPFKQREQQDILNRELELARAKERAATDPEGVEQTAKNLLGLPPSMWSQVLGRTSHSRAAVFNRVSELTNKPLAQIQRDYETGLAGGKAGAVYDTAGKGQQTARAANSVKLLIPGLKEASAAFSRTDVPLVNTAYSAYDKATGGDRAMGFQQYLTDTKLKMASALMQGGVPTDQATNIIEHAFPAGMTHDQVLAASDNIDAIMNTQIQGGLTHVGLPPAGGAQGGALPAAPGKVQKIGRFQVEVH